MAVAWPGEHQVAAGCLGEAAGNPGPQRGPDHLNIKDPCSIYKGSENNL